MDRRNFIQGIGSAAIAGTLVQPASAALGVNQVAPSGTRTSNLLLKICGIGTGGCNIINHLMAMGVAGVAEYVCIAMDRIDHDRCTAHRKLFVDSGQTPDGSEVVALKNSGEFAALLQGADVVLMIAGLGGDAEERITSYAGGYAKKLGLQVASVLVMPFFHRGIDDEMGARHGMVGPQVHSHVSMVVSTESIYASLGLQRTMAEELAAVDHAIFRAVQTIVYMTTSGPGMVHAAPEEANHASARIYATELFRDMRRCAVETEVAIYEMKSVANSLREAISNLKTATDDHHLAAEAFHYIQVDVFAANAAITRMESWERTTETQADLIAAMNDREQLIRTLNERRKVLAYAAGELGAWNYNCRHGKSEIERTREAITWWSGNLQERLTELRQFGAFIEHEPEVPTEIDRATNVLVHAKDALGDIEIARLVKGVEEDLA